MSLINNINNKITTLWHTIMKGFISMMSDANVDIIDNVASIDDLVQLCLKMGAKFFLSLSNDIWPLIRS